MRSIPNAQLAILPGDGHGEPIEDPPRSNAMAAGLYGVRQFSRRGKPAFCMRS
jgi:hypothetical protein